MTKNSFTIKSGVAAYLADAALAAAPKDDWTPILSAAKFIVEKNRVTVVSTDRYRVHVVYGDLEKAVKPHEFVMPRSLLMWLAKNAGTFNRRASSPFTPVVTITTQAPGTEKDDHGLCEIIVRQDAEVDTDVLVMRGTLVKGNFPPVLDMVKEIREAEESKNPLRLNLDYVASLRKLQPERSMPARMKFTVAKNPSKPGPIHVEYSRGEKTYAEAILQPNLEIS